VIYRERIIKYRQEGHTLKETSEVFKVLILTIGEWENKLEEEGDLKNKPLNRTFKKMILVYFLILPHK